MCDFLPGHTLRGLDIAQKPPSQVALAGRVTWLQAPREGVGRPSQVGAVGGKVHKEEEGHGEPEKGVRGDPAVSNAVDLQGQGHGTAENSEKQGF